MNLLRIPAILLLTALPWLETQAKPSEVTGRYANNLTQADVVQIKAAISKERSVSRNVKKIEAVGPDKVAIQTTARTAVDQDTYYDFNAYKRAGTWTIDQSSIQTTIEQRDFRTNCPTIIR